MKRNDITDIDTKIFFQNYENLFNVYDDSDGNYYYNISRKINIPNDLTPSSYEDYILSVGDTWTTLAHVYYGDVRLWWIILAANPDQNPLLLPQPGEVIRLLNPNVVQVILSEIRSAD